MNMFYSEEGSIDLTQLLQCGFERAYPVLEFFTLCTLMLQVGQAETVGGPVFW